MARKLSKFARWAGAQVILAGPLLLPLLFTQAAFAETQVAVTLPPNVVDNPFAAGGRAAKPIATAGGERELPQASDSPSLIQNPFAHMALSPQSDPPLSPPFSTTSQAGPMSRWQRSIAHPNEPSSVRSAILAGQLLDDPLTTKLAAGNRTATIAQREIENDSPAGSILAPPDPIQFAPRTLNQPAWLAEELVLGQSRGLAAAARPSVPSDMDIDAALEATPIPTSSDVNQANGFIRNPLAPEGAAYVSADSDWSAIVVSDYVDTPDSALADAQRAAQTAHTEQQLTTVIELCQRGLRANPPQDLSLALRRMAAWAHNRRGELHSEAGDSRPALADFQRAIAFDPECWAAVHNRGVTFAQQNQFGPALNDFNRALVLNPGFAVASRNRAELNAALGRMGEAVRDYSRAIEQLPEDAELLRARGYAWQQLGDFDRALADVNQSLTLAPEQPDTFTQRGSLFAEQCEYDQALSNFQQALAINPNWGDALRKLAWLRATCPDDRFRDTQQALRAANQAVQISQAGDSFALDTLAAAQANAGHFREAIRAEEQAIAVATQNTVEPMRARLALYQLAQPYRTASTPNLPAVSTSPSSSNVMPASATNPASPSTRRQFPTR